MAARKNPAPAIIETRFARVDPTAPLTRAETCTTADCTAPRIRLNALKCTAHELVYRAAAKERAAARKAAAKATATPKATKTTQRPARNSGGAKRASTPPVRPMGSGAVARNAATA